MKTPITERLSDDDVREIRRRYATEPISYEELAAGYGVSGSSICRVVRGEAFGHLPTYDNDNPHCTGAKVAPADVREIRERYAAGGVSYADLAAEYPVRRQQIGDIVRGDAWANVGGPLTHPDGPGSDAYNRASDAVVNVSAAWPEPKPNWFEAERDTDGSETFNRNNVEGRVAPTERAGHDHP